MILSLATVRQRLLRARDPAGGSVLEEASMLASESLCVLTPVLSLLWQRALGQATRWSLPSFLGQNYRNQRVVVRIPMTYHGGEPARSSRHPNAPVTFVPPCT